MCVRNGYVVWIISIQTREKNIGLLLMYERSAMNTEQYGRFKIDKQRKKTRNAEIEGMRLYVCVCVYFKK